MMGRGLERICSDDGLRARRPCTSPRDTPPERRFCDQGRSPGSRVNAGFVRPSRRRSASGRWTKSSPLTVAGAASASAQCASPNSLLASGWIRRTLIAIDHRCAPSRVKPRAGQSDLAIVRRDHPTPPLRRRLRRASDAAPARPISFLEAIRAKRDSCRGTREACRRPARRRPRALDQRSPARARI